MELFVVLLFLGAAAGLVYLLWQLRAAVKGMRSLTRRIEEVEVELEGVAASLGRRLASLEKRAFRQEEEPAEPTPTRPPTAEFPKTRPSTPAPFEPPPRPSPPQTPPPLPRADREPPPLPTPRARIEWERWVGVRGAAVLGGVALALAGLLFLKYSIERGLIPPAVRVALATAVGLSALVGSEVMRRRGYRPAADAVAGAGIVLLYGAFWAARVLYGLIGTGFAFVLLVLVTAAAGTLAWRHRSLVVAVLGLAGGFATPFLLSSGRDNPLGLFGYLLLLDAGVLALARARRWPWLAAGSLLLTFGYQALWIFLRMDPGRLWLGLGILAVFALLFAGGGQKAGERNGVWQYTQAGAVLLPFAFAFYFGAQARLAAPLYAVGCLAFLLSAAAQWVGRSHRVSWLASGAAAADVGVIVAWLARGRIGVAEAWEASAVCVALALCFHAFSEADRFLGTPSEGARGSEVGALVAGLGLFGALAAAPFVAFRTPFWPWLAGWLGLAAILVRQSWSPERKWRQTAGALGLALAFAVFHLSRPRFGPWAPPALFPAVAVAVALILQVATLARRDATLRWWAVLGAAVFPLCLLIALLREAITPSLAPLVYFATTLTLGALGSLAAARLGRGEVHLAAMVTAALGHGLWSVSYPGLAGLPGGVPLLGLAAGGAAAVWFTLWPFLAGGRFLSHPWTRRAAALAGPCWLFAMRHLYTARFGTGTIGIVPVALGGLSILGLYLARRHWPLEDPARRSSLAWFGAAALGFAAVAVPLQLEKEWITIAWALEGLGTLALWRRLDHPGLKYFALALLGAAAVRLIANPAVTAYYPRSGWPVLNWLLYTYLVPAAALVASAALLRPVEVPRHRDWERALYRKGRPWGAAACGVAAVLVVFAWINLAVTDAFSEGPRLVLTLRRLPARDLTLSLSWAVYALILLALGVKRRSGGLRWMSLAFLVLTIGKVFLYDLGELGDLYRVASLAGLAVSLILVSLAYQRFVFRKHPEEGTE